MIELAHVRIYGVLCCKSLNIYKNMPTTNGNFFYLLLLKSSALVQFLEVSAEKIDADLKPAIKFHTASV